MLKYLRMLLNIKGCGNMLKNIRSSNPDEAIDAVKEAEIAVNALRYYLLLQSEGVYTILALGCHF